MSERLAIRIGIVVIFAAAAFGAWCTTQPGFEIYRNNSDDCLGRAMSFEHSEGPCEHREWRDGTQPAGSAENVIGLLLAAAPGLIVLGIPTRRALLTWAGVIWGGLVLFTIARGTTHESDGCVSSTRLVTLWPRRALGYASVAVLMGPAFLAAYSFVADYVRRRRGVT